MQPARFSLTLVLALLPLVGSGCDESDPEARRSITISGGIENHSGEPLPDDASIVVAWALDDESYVAGVGTIAADGGSFRVELPEPPTENALMGGAVGIGIIVAVTGPQPPAGTAIAEENVIGLVENHAIIYVADRDGFPAEAFWWLSNMPDGFSLGIGVEAEGETFEGFEPVPAGSADLTIDDLENLDVVNWS